MMGKETQGDIDYMQLVLDGTDMPSVQDVVLLTESVDERDGVIHDYSLTSLHRSSATLKNSTISDEQLSMLVRREVNKWCSSHVPELLKVLVRDLLKKYDH